MKWLTVVALIAVSITGAYGYGANKGCGLIITAQEVGSSHYEQVILGIAPSDFDFGMIIDLLSKVHINLPDGWSIFSFRPNGSSSKFDADIWWTGAQNGQFELYLEYFFGTDENFEWTLPDNPAHVTLVTPSATSDYDIPLETGPFSIYGQDGPSNISVDLGYEPVPEPSSLLPVAMGVPLLFVRRKHYS